jgi:hypothetical protein
MRLLRPSSTWNGPAHWQLWTGPAPSVTPNGATRRSLGGRNGLAAIGGLATIRKLHFRNANLNVRFWRRQR